MATTSGRLSATYLSGSLINRQKLLQLTSFMSIIRHIHAQRTVFARNGAGKTMKKLYCGAAAFWPADNPSQPPLAESVGRIGIDWRF
jgi:hypothetical protein